VACPSGRAAGPAAAAKEAASFFPVFGAAPKALSLHDRSQFGYWLVMRGTCDCFGHQPLMIRTATAFALAALVFGLTTAQAENVAFTHATIINPANSAVIENGILTIEGDHITAVGPPNDTKIPDDARTIDCTGKFILPGYIDTHVHFFQSGDLFTRPDVVDLNAVRPYKDEVAWIKSHLADTFARYLRSGITSVVDVGGPLWNF
jgi:hypothetical protein